jgi:hypothetical protein
MLSNSAFKMPPSRLLFVDRTSGSQRETTVSEGGTQQIVFAMGIEHKILCFSCFWLFLKF